MLARPAPGPARRRLVALAVCAFAALVAGVIAGSGGDSAPHQATRGDALPRPAVAQAKALPLSRQIGQTLIIAFRGPGVPSYVKRALREGRAAGVILFGGNFDTPAQLRDLTASLQRAGHGYVLICVDQEGGPVRILPWAFPRVAQSVQATPALARQQARLAARDLRTAGVNVTLAPVADVGAPGSVMRGRAFPGGATQVAQTVRAAVRGYAGAKVAATLKHFPGLGEAGRNTDDVPVSISSPAAALDVRDLPPFVSGIRAGAPIVMTSHALYSGLDARNIASQSSRIIRTLLRGRLGFDGVVMTDSMEADAVLKRSSLELAALRAISAGSDLLLLTGAGSFPRVSKQLTVAARRSPRFRARIAEAAARVIALKRTLGLEGWRPYLGHDDPDGRTGAAGHDGR